MVQGFRKGVFLGSKFGMICFGSLLGGVSHASGTWVQERFYCRSVGCRCGDLYMNVGSTPMCDRVGRLDVRPWHLRTAHCCSCLSS